MTMLTTIITIMTMAILTDQTDIIIITTFPSSYRGRDSSPSARAAAWSLVNRL
jgi:hypothetical protein